MPYPYVNDTPVEVRVSVAIDPETREYIYEWFATVVMKDHANLLSPDAPIEVRDVDAQGHAFMRRVPRADVRDAGECSSIWHRLDHSDGETTRLCPKCRLRSGATDSQAMRDEVTR